MQNNKNTQKHGYYKKSEHYSIMYTMFIINWHSVLDCFYNIVFTQLFARGKLILQPESNHNP